MLFENWKRTSLPDVAQAQSRSNVSVMCLNAVRSILVLLALGPIVVHAADAKRPPNIIFFFADDLGIGELGCYGQKKIQTPHVDQLAQEGMKFTQHYSGNAVCAPSRCCLMTGKHSGHAYIRSNREFKPEGQEPIPAEEVTLAELLKEKGYVTGAMGKWGLGPVNSSGDPLSQGFDHFYGYNCQRVAHNYYPTHLWKDREHIRLEGNDAGLKGEKFAPDLYTDAALQFIEANKDRPFFLYFPTIVPHVALQVPEDSLAQYTGKFEEIPYEGNKGYLPHPTPYAAYAAMVSRMDRDLGRTLDLLRRLNLENETIVIFTSDNGPTHNVGGADSDFFESTAGRRGRKGSLYEGGIRAPAIVRWPGHIAPGTVSNHVCANYDWLPTLLDLTDEPAVKLPAGVDGISFAPTLLGKPGEQKQHEFLYWEFPGYGGQQALRMGDWKLVRQNLMPQPAKGQNKQKRKKATLELFDLKSDENETHDIADAHPDVVAKMQAIMFREHVPSNVFRFPALDQPE